MKRSQGTTPCVVKDSSCHIMQDTINGHEEFVLQFKDMVFFFLLLFIYTFFVKEEKKFKKNRFRSKVLSFFSLCITRIAFFFPVLQIVMS